MRAHSPFDVAMWGYLRGWGAGGAGSGFEAGDDGFDDALSFGGVGDLDGGGAGLFGGIVVAAGEDGVADEYHVGDGDVEDVAEFLDAVGLVDAGLGDVDGGGAAGADGEAGERDTR